MEKRLGNERKRSAAVEYLRQRFTLRGKELNTPALLHQFPCLEAMLLEIGWISYLC